MPAHTPRTSGGSTGSTAVMRALDQMTPLQKRVFFRIGANLAGLVLLRFLMNDIIRVHEHASAWAVGWELGGSVALLVLAIGFMVPPFGMWMITHVPIPKFLVRGGSK